MGKKLVNFNLHSFFLVVAAMLSIPHLGVAKTVFCGVGNDGYFNDELAGALNSLANTASDVLVIADMCYAGGLVGGTSDFNPASGPTFFGSSSELDSSYSFTSDSYSQFTDSLISGLSNWAADSDSDGILLASEWFQYSYDLTVDSLGVQHPVYFGEDLMIASQRPAPVPIPRTVFLLGPSFFLLWLRRKFGKID